MKYQEWNNCIAEYFFNEFKYGTDVCLYLTKSDLISIGKEYFDLDTPEQDIWEDYIRAIKSGLPGSKDAKTITEKARFSYDLWERWRGKSFDKIPMFYPTYIAYLVFFILPLTEDNNSGFHGREYYGRLNGFLKLQAINQQINSLQELEPLWNDLEDWSIIKNNGDLGFFSLGTYSINYKYVGKPFAQCVFSPNALKRLPLLFFEAGLTPNTFYSDLEIKNNLLKFGAAKLGLRSQVLELIKKSETNELGATVIQLVKRELLKWTGESHEYVNTGTTEKTKRNYTVSPLHLQLKISNIKGEIQFAFRMYSANDFPEDLKFNGVEILNTGTGFSNPLILPEHLALDAFDLKDDFNNWIARFPSKDVRLFVNGGIYQISSDYLIESKAIHRSEKMYLLCKNNVRAEILNWGKHFKNGCFNEIDGFKGMPTGYSLFLFINPEFSLPGIQALTVNTNKEIQLVDGIKLSHRRFTDDFLPDVEVINAIGDETVFLQYINESEKILLEKKDNASNRWLLPPGLFIGIDFHIKIDQETYQGNNLAYSITSMDGSSKKLNDEALPKRDAFGRKITENIEKYTLGSNTIGSELPKQISYTHLFGGLLEDLDQPKTTPSYLHSQGNFLLSYLTFKQVSSTEDFYSTFGFLHAKSIQSDNIESSINFSKIKRASLNMYDYLGYLDYEYESKTIVVNKPQFILIPCTKGRTVLLIGGRDPQLVKSILDKAPEYNLQVEIKKQSLSNAHLLLPDAITVKAFGKSSEKFGESNLQKFAEDIGVSYNPADLIQVGMLQFAADLDEYENDLIKNNETDQEDYDWARKIFNPETLIYERSLGESFNRTLSLVEYKLNEYTYYNKIWKDLKCYKIDQNWGKFLILRHYKKEVILYDSVKQKVAVPFELPLPRLLAESIMLLSGIAPVYEQINSKPYRIYENIPGIFIKNLFNKLMQKTTNYTL